MNNITKINNKNIIKIPNTQASLLSIRLPLHLPLRLLSRLPLFLFLFMLSLLFLSTTSFAAGEFSKIITDDIPNSIREISNSLFGGFTSGTCDPPGEWTTGGAPRWVWLNETVLVGFIIVLIALMIYMAGIVFQSQNLIGIAREEFFQMFFTFIRLVFQFSAVAATSAFYIFSVAGGGDPVYAAQTYIDASMLFSIRLINDMVNNLSFLLAYNMVIHTLFSATMWFGVTFRAMFTFNLGPVLKPVVDIIGFSMQFMSVGIGEWVLHLTTLCMIKRFTWALFIPISMLLRTISFTRGAGDTLFCLIFAFSVVYPFMIITNYEIYKLMLPYLSDNQNAVYDFINSTGLSGVGGIVIGLSFLMAGAIIPLFLSAGLTVAYELIRNSVFYIIMMTILLPFINIFVTLTAAREFARLFNVDVNFMAFVKLI